MRAIGVAALLVLAWPATASAVDYGGGQAPPSAERAHRDLALVTLRNPGNGQVTVRAAVAAGCGVGRIRRTVTPAADGSFSFAATIRTRTSAPGVRQISRLTVAGRVGATSAAGTATANVRFRRRGRIVERCASGTDAWQVRAAVAGTTPAPPRALGAYYGTTSQAPRAIVVRVGANAGRVATAAFQYRMTCRNSVFDGENITPGGAIAADGTFHLRERFAQRFAEGNERYRVAVDGRFTTNGVSGTLTVRSVLRRRGGGRVLDRCTTGTTSFAAAL
jgi:hypothetical protein